MRNYFNTGLLITLFLASINLNAQDSLVLERTHFGVFCELEFNGSRLLDTDYGNGYHIGGFYEIEILERVNWTLQLGYRHKKYTPRRFSSDRIYDSDTTFIIDKFEETRISNRLAGGTDLKFYYVKNEINNFQLFLGLGYFSEFILNHERTYAYTGSTFYITDEPVSKDFRNTPNFPNSNDYKFIHNFSISTGFSFRKVLIELFVRKTSRKENSAGVGVNLAYYLK